MSHKKQLIERFRQGLSARDTLQYNNGTYTGELQNGVRQGKGIL